MQKTFNPQYKQRIKEKFEANRFSHHIGFQLTDIGPGFTTGQLAIEPFHLQQNGYVHGGLLLTLSDIVAGFAAFTLLPADLHVVTAEIKVSCLHPGLGEKLIAKGFVLKPGKKIHFCESEIYAVSEGVEKLIAKSSSSMAVVAGK